MDDSRQLLQQIHAQNMTNDLMFQILDELKKQTKALEKIAENRPAAKRRTFSAKDLSEMLQISEVSALNMMKQPGFPTITGVGRRYLCYADDFFKWEQEQRKK